MGGDFSLLHVPSRSMRDNLLFTNIDETENDKKDTEEVLNEWLDKYMGITNIAFERVHRLQIKHTRPGEEKKPRTIVAKFTFFKDREKVRKASRRLKGTKFGMHEQFPKEVEHISQPYTRCLDKRERIKNK